METVVVSLITNMAVVNKELIWVTGSITWREIHVAGDSK